MELGENNHHRHQLHKNNASFFPVIFHVRTRLLTCLDSRAAPRRQPHHPSLATEPRLAGRAAPLCTGRTPAPLVVASREPTPSPTRAALSLTPPAHASCQEEEELVAFLHFFHYGPRRVDPDGSEMAPPN